MSLARLLIIALAIGLGLTAYFVVRRLLIVLASRLIARTETRWDDIFLERGVFRRLAYLAPGLSMYLISPLALEGYDELTALAVRAIGIYLIFIGIGVIDSLLSAASDIYETLAVSREIPIKGFVQTAKIILYFVGGVFMISIAIHKTPIFLISGLGALTAVLLLIFKDPILGLVGGVQLTVYYH